MKIIINTDNDAFSHNLGGELAVIFEKIVVQVDMGRNEGMILDSNGNRVGNWALKV